MQARIQSLKRGGGLEAFLNIIEVFSIVIPNLMFSIYDTLFVHPAYGYSKLILFRLV